MVQSWITNSPAWVDIRQRSTSGGDPSLSDLDPGERDAIALAIELHADLLLIDDREGVAAAREKGFRVAGTLIVIAMAAQRGLLNLIDAVDRLKRTNFRYRQEVIDNFIAQYRGKA